MKISSYQLVPSHVPRHSHKTTSKMEGRIECGNSRKAMDINSLLNVMARNISLRKTSKQAWVNSPCWAILLTGKRKLRFNNYSQRSVIIWRLVNGNLLEYVCGACLNSVTSLTNLWKRFWGRLSINHITQGNYSRIRLNVCKPLAYGNVQCKSSVLLFCVQL